MSALQNDCTNFQLHAWKQEICSNCMKSRKSHRESDDPQSKMSENCRGKGSGAVKRNNFTSTTNRDCVSNKTNNSNNVKVNDKGRRTYNYGGYRSKMKRDNESTDSQLSVASTGSEKSTKSTSSITSTRSVRTSANQSAKRGQQSKQSNNVLNGSAHCSSNNNSTVKMRGKAAASTPDGNTNIEQALKTLTSTAKASPKCERKGSRTTMSYKGTTASVTPSGGASTLEDITKSSEKTSMYPVSSIDVRSSGEKPSSSSKNRVSIPLDTSVGKLSASVNTPHKLVTMANTTEGQPTAGKTALHPSTTAAPKVQQNTGSFGSSLLKSKDSKKEVKKDTTKTDSVSKPTPTKVEKKQILIDKGKYSTEKIIFDKSTVITTKGKVLNKRLSKEISINNASSATKSQQQKSVSGKSDLSKSVVSDCKEKQEETSKVSSDKSRSGRKEAECVAEQKVTRSRSKTSRPSAPPPSVPSTSGQLSPPSRAMMDSFHSDISTSSNDSKLSQVRGDMKKPTKTTSVVNSTSQKRNSANDSFSDLYNDIMNTLSETKDINPDMLDKLKGDCENKKGTKSTDHPSRQKQQPQEQQHYYHKYDLSKKSTSQKRRNDETAECLTLSKNLAGDGSSSIIIETMNTSFHGGSKDSDVNDVTAQTLAMPYNIVDVSTIVPRGKSPRLPATPAPESRNSTLNRNTLTKAKQSSCTSSGGSPASKSPVVKETVKEKKEPDSLQVTHCRCVHLPYSLLL